MDSLTTAYLVCIFIGSAGSVVGAFIGNKMSPIPSSAKPIVPEPVQMPAPTPAPSPQNIEQTAPPTLSASV